LKEKDKTKKILFLLKDMKPSSALTLQLLEYEKKLRGGSSSTRSKFQLKRLIGLASQNWIPITIYLLVALILAKFVYETIVGFVSREIENEDDMVCV
jgi:hypothetical protein